VISDLQLTSTPGGARQIIWQPWGHVILLEYVADDFATYAGSTAHDLVITALGRKRQIATPKPPDTFELARFILRNTRRTKHGR